MKFSIKQLSEYTGVQPEKLAKFFTTLKKATEKKAQLKKRAQDSTGRIANPLFQLIYNMFYKASGRDPSTVKLRISPRRRSEHLNPQTGKQDMDIYIQALTGDKDEINALQNWLDTEGVKELLGGKLKIPNGVDIHFHVSDRTPPPLSNSMVPIVHPRKPNTEPSAKAPGMRDADLPRELAGEPSETTSGMNRWQEQQAAKGKSSVRRAPGRPQPAQRPQLGQIIPGEVGGIVTRPDGTKWRRSGKGLVPMDSKGK